MKLVSYTYESSSGILWKEFGDKETDPIYKGDVEHGRPNGVGVMTFPDGRKYVGENKDGFPNGQGTYTFPNGKKGLGEFRDGRPWNITEYDKDGDITGKYVNGKKIKQ